jgi:hypothetical protein
VAFIVAVSLKTLGQSRVNLGALLRRAHEYSVGLVIQSVRWLKSNISNKSPIDGPRRRVVRALPGLRVLGPRTLILFIAQHRADATRCDQLAAEALKILPAVIGDADHVARRGP